MKEKIDQEKNVELKDQKEFIKTAKKYIKTEIEREQELVDRKLQLRVNCEKDWEALIHSRITPSFNKISKDSQNNGTAKEFQVAPPKNFEDQDMYNFYRKNRQNYIDLT